MNDPVLAWVLQVYLRDQGAYLCVVPSVRIYGGWRAYVEVFAISAMRYVRIADVDDRLIQVAARRAAEAAGCDLSGFEAWRAGFERRALPQRHQRFRRQRRPAQ